MELKKEENVLDTQKSINMQTKSCDINIQNSKTMETQLKLTQMNSQTSICSAEDFPANHFSIAGKRKGF